MPTLLDKFRGCLLGAAIGDIVGAVVEAESPEYIARTYGSVDDILAADSITEFAGAPWQVGRFTDDTQMTLCVAEWLIEDQTHSPERLLAKFADAYEPFRRYGPSVEMIFRLYPEHKAQWRALSTAMFPYGSYGNGSAMRVAPIGLAYRDDLARASSVAIESSRPTHSHPLAYQGAVIQSIAVAMASVSEKFDPQTFLQPMRASLRYFSDLLQDVSKYARALDLIENGLSTGTSCREMSESLGTGIAAHKAVPMAIYCFLRHPDSFARVIHETVFIGGDTDTIACMASAISGAFLGVDAIPATWIAGVREPMHTVAEITRVADRLHGVYASGSSR